MNDEKNNPFYDSEKIFEMCRENLLPGMEEIDCKGIEYIVNQGRLLLATIPNQDLQLKYWMWVQHNEHYFDVSKTSEVQVFAFR